MRKGLWLGGGAALAVAIQFVPVVRDNPAASAPIVAPPEVAQVLERSCYDCHSSQTHWPWYAWVAPVSWLVAHDVHEGRGEMNFSDWEGYTAKKKAKLADEMVEMVERREMPLWIYLGLHPRARVTLGELERLRAWSESLQPVSPAPAP